MKKDSIRTLELLAPAKDADTAIAAINHGADAVYMGGPGHGARAAAGNSLDDIARVVEYAHLFKVRVYVTVNTLVYDSETDEVAFMIRGLYKAGVDALIVQDLGILRMDIPPIALHASTQCDTRTPGKADWLARLGFSQIVLPREMSLDDIRAVSEKVDVPLEVFVHGALCVSYSGDCQASLLATGRSANRGECSQMCRLTYDLVDGDGRAVVKSRHLLSLKDMNRIASLEALAEAGASSFKIEGRLKDAVYVKNVTAAYSAALDRIVELYPEKYRRASDGRSIPSFRPDLAKSFNRGYTDYFLSGIDRKVSMASFDTPKDSGTAVGKVKAVKDGVIIAELDRGVTLAPGDGLCYFASDGSLKGFRVNKAEGPRIYPSPGASLPSKGCVLRRNNDSGWEKALKADGVRKISVDAALSLTPSHHLALSFTAPDGSFASAVSDEALEPTQARSPQKEVRKNALAKLGNTPFQLRSLSDSVDESVFIPAGMLASLRRDATEALLSARKASYPYDYRRPQAADAHIDMPPTTYHDNVANSLAAGLYADCGVEVREKALEVSRMPKGEVRVMTTRYCLRRELGACLKDPSARRLKGPLYLVRGNSRWRLDFDCARCGMAVVSTDVTRR